MLGTLKPFSLFLGGSACVIMLATLIGNTSPAFLVLLCLFILLAGLPHGAFDYYILSARYEGGSFACALAVYLCLIAMTAMFWWLAPLWFLSSFLAYSAYHFGDSDWPDERASSSNGRGGCRLSDCPAYSRLTRCNRCLP